MTSPLQVRLLTESEERSLHQGLRSGDAFVLKRCQVLLASARNESVEDISRSLGFSRQGVRNILYAFSQERLSVLSRRSNRPKTGPAARATLAEQERERLRRILEQSPRGFGKETSLWTLALLTQVIYEQKLSPRLLSDETVRIALKRMGLDWKRVKHHINSPDPAYTRKKSDATA